MRSSFLLAAGFVLLAAMAQAQPPARRGPFPDTRSGIHLEMVFNYAMNGDYDPETGVVDLVWGADLPDAPPGMYNSAYIPFDVDDFQNDVAWYQQHHPDWLAYECDRTTLAYVPGSDRAPLDFANPDVRTYQWANWVDHKIDVGYRSIAVDLLALTNDQGRCGHFDLSHNWVPQYNGHADQMKFRRDVLNWERMTYRHIHAYSATATMQVNAVYVYDTPYADDNLALMTTADLLFDERGFTEFGYAPAVPTPEHWQTIVDKIAYVQSKGLCYTLENEEPGTNGQITAAERQWAMANYLLVRDGCTYMYVTGQQDYGTLVDSNDYRIAVGRPKGGKFMTQGIWERNYTSGLALVNPFDATATVTLPHGHWQDVNGNPAGPSVTLTKQTALVLLKAP